LQPGRVVACRRVFPPRAPGNPRPQGLDTQGWAQARRTNSSTTVPAVAAAAGSRRRPYLAMMYLIITIHHRGCGSATNTSFTGMAVTVLAHPGRVHDGSAVPIRSPINAGRLRGDPLIRATAAAAGPVRVGSSRVTEAQQRLQPTFPACGAGRGGMRRVRADRLAGSGPGGGGGGAGCTSPPSRACRRGREDLRHLHRQVSGDRAPCARGRILPPPGRSSTDRASPRAAVCSAAWLRAVRRSRRRHQLMQGRRRRPHRDRRTLAGTGTCPRSGAAQTGVRQTSGVGNREGANVREASPRRAVEVIPLTPGGSWGGRAAAPHARQLAVAIILWTHPAIAR